MKTVLKTVEELNWLSETHGVDTRNICFAIVYGDEESPDKVNVYTHFDHKTIPYTYTKNETTGKLERPDEKEKL